MPYAQDKHGIYKITNLATNQCYVGGSKRVYKRAAEHFRLLRAGLHPNVHLQESFSKHGEVHFKWDLEVVCDDPSDLDLVEEVFLSGEAFFPEPVVFNISTTAKKPMFARKHSVSTKQKISFSRQKNTGYQKTPLYRETLRLAHRKRHLNDPKFLEKVKYLVDNDHLSYAERGRRFGLDTSSARKLALKYADLKGKL